MKKRVLSVLLVIALLVTVGIVAAQANETDPTPAEIKAEAQTIITAAKAMTFEEGNLPTYCPKCGDNVTWTAVTKESWEANTNRTYKGHYYLAESFEVDYAGLAFNFQGASCLHLNGNGVKNVTTGSWNCVLRGNTELNIFDNAAGTGYIDGGTTQGALWCGAATTNIYGGTYKGTNGTATIEIRDNNFVNFFDGDLASGHIRYTSVASSAFQMYGGTLSSTGNIKSNNGSATTEALLGIHGGDVDMTVNTWGKKVVVTGGSIKTLNSAVPTGTSGISISGNPQIETLGLSTSYVYPTFGVLTEGASIGLGTYTGVISTAYETEQEAQAVADSFPVAAGKEVTVNDDLTLSYGKRTTPYSAEEIVTLSKEQSFGTTATSGYCYHCNADVTWQPLTAVSSGLATGHYFLANDIIDSNTGAILYLNKSGGATLCLHLNGKTISNDTTGDMPAIRVWSTDNNINIMGNGTVTNASTNWGALDCQNNGTVNVYGGTYRNTKGNMRSIYAKSTCIMNLYSAEITGGHLETNNTATLNVYDGTYPSLKATGTGIITVKGGAITTVAANAGTLNVEGGTITGTTTVKNATTISGGNVNGAVTVTGGTFTVSGGAVNNTVTATGGAVSVTAGSVTTLTTSVGATVSGGNVGTLTATAGTVVLSGKPTVTLNTSIAVDATGLTGGQISGMKEGVFTTAFGSKAAAEAVIPYFVVGDGMAVTATDDFKLTYGTKTYTPEEIVALSAQQTFGTEETEAFCYACGSMQTWKPLTGAAAVWQGDMYSHKHFFVANDIQEAASDGMFYFASWGNQGTWCLHLNGKTIENTAEQAVIRQHNYRCQVNVLGSGTLINHANVWGTIAVAGGVSGDVIGGVNVYGGDLYNDGENSWALTANGGYVNVYGGSIPNGAMNVTAAEVNLYDADYKYINQNGTGTLTIHDGNYTNVRVYNTGEVNINGGTVSQLVANDKAGTIKLAGAPTVGAISLAEGKVLDLNGMTGGSLNVGSFDGVFTTAFTGGESAAKAVAAFVTSSSKAIAVTDLNELTTAAAAAAIVDSNGQKAYATYADAEAAYANGYIKLFGNDAINLTKNVTIDFNGHNVDVTGNVTLTGFDSTTKDSFSNEPGYMTIADTITVLVPEVETETDGTVSGYLAVTDDYTTFTYYTMKLSGVALKAKSVAGVLSDVGMYYKGTWSFNDYLPKGYVEAGVVVNIGDPATLAPGAASSGWYSTEAADITNGEPMTSVLVDGIMTADEAKYDANTTNGQTDINAAAFVTINGQTNILTGIKSLSVRDVLDMIERSETAFAANETKLYGDGKFYAMWTPYVDFASWDLYRYSQWS